MATATQAPANGHQPEQDWERDELVRRAIREVYAPKASDEQFLVFLAECKRRSAYPGKHIHFRLQRNKEKEWDATLHQVTERWVEKPVFITGIDFFRLVAQRTGKYAGQKPLAWYYRNNEDGGTTRRTIPEWATEPYCAEATVLRSDFTEPMVRIARWDAYKQTYRRGNDEILTHMWQRMGPEMLAKCAEAQALRAAFPEELGGLYIREEFQDEPEAVAPSPGPAHEVPALPEASVAPSEPQVSPGAATTTAGAGSTSFSAPVSSDKEKIDAVKRQFNAKERVERPRGVEGMRWYVRGPLAEAKVKTPNNALRAYLQACLKVHETNKLTEAQIETVLTVLDGALLRGGAKAVAELVEHGAVGTEKSSA